MYFPDGGKVTDNGFGLQTVYDRNGNYRQISDTTYNGHAATTITDQVGRQIIVEHDSGNNRDYIYKAGVNGAQIQTTIQWQSVSVNSQYYNGDQNIDGSPIIVSLSQALGMVSQVTLPSQLGSPSYSFQYSSQYGKGELTQMILPSGAQTTYSFVTYGSSTPLFEDFVYNGVKSKNLTYNAEYDNGVTPITETSTYALNWTNIDVGARVPVDSSVTEPDGSVEKEYYRQFNTNATGLEYLPYKVEKSDGSVEEQIWQLNQIPARNLTWQFIGNRAEQTNALVKTKFVSIPDVNGNLTKTSISSFSYDKNGNLIETREYDYADYSSISRDSNGNPTTIPTGATLKRTTQNSYYVATADSADSSTNPSSIYCNPGSSVNIRAVFSTEILDASGSSVFRSENFYDNATSTANVLQNKTWDSTKGSLATPNSGGSKLYTNNFISLSATYNNFGRPLTKTDANGNVTRISYGFIGSYDNLYPTQTVSAYGTPVARTTSMSYDFQTGVVTTTTDNDNSVSNVTEYDALGRPKKIRSAVNSPLESWTTTDYYDAGRYVVTKSDLFTTGDGKKVATRFFDQLERVRLSKTLEDASFQSATNETDGIKVQTRYKTGNPSSYELTSNPYRSSYSTGETPSTMGWARSLTLNTGRHSEIETFDGPTLPAPWGNNSNSTGKIQTDIDADATTVTDQAGKKRRSIINGVGSLLRVDEPNSIGQLGATASPNQSTTYTYDALNNLISVNQGGQSRSFAYNSLSRMSLATNPESGAVSTTYDANGNILTQRDSRGIKTIFDYDALNRLTKKCFRIVGSGSLGATNCGQAAGEQLEPNTSDVTYTYDSSSVPFSKGRLTKVQNGASTTEYLGYDADGNILTHRQTVDSNQYSTSYTYNLAGDLVEETYPSGRVVRNTFESDGDLSQILSKKDANHGFFQYAGQFSYSPSGKLVSWRMGNNAWESVLLNSRLQPKQIALGTTANSDNLWKINYEFGELQANGTVDVAKNNSDIGKQIITVPTVGQTAGITATQTFIYDSNRRIKTAIETVSNTQSWKQTFDYDRFGNRTFIGADTTTLGSCPLAVCNPAINTSDNRISGGQGYAFDGRGNVIQNADNGKFVYDAANKISEFRNASTNVLVSKNYYDGDGSRVKIDEGGVSTIFVYDAFDKVVAEYTVNAPANQIPKVNYMTADMLGTPRVITDQNRQISSRRDMTPFGEEITVGVGGRSLGQQYSVVDGVRQKFTGQQRDEIAKLDYFNARHFSYGQGRFVSPDSFGGKSSNPQSLNLYAYALNNPLKWVDPTGHFVDDPEKECVNCVLDSNNYLYREKSIYLIGKSTVNVNGDGVPAGPSSVVPKVGPGPLPASITDYLPVYGPLRGFAYNYNCRTGGCNISGATGNFIQLAADLSPLGTAAREINLARNALVGEFVRDATKNGAKQFIREPQSLMDQMVLGAAKNGEGTAVIENLRDDAFKGMTKMVYGEISEQGIRSEVHFVKNPATGELMDFKFKPSTIQKTNSVTQYANATKSGTIVSPK